MVVHDLVTDVLPCSDQRVLTNLDFGVVPKSHSFPPAFSGETFLDRIGQFVERASKVDAADVVSRIQPIDRAWLDRWKAGDVPSELKTWDVDNALIVLDEAHNFCGAKHSKEAKRAWQEFVGELRHRGGAIIFVTQHPKKLAVELMDEAGKRLALVDSEEERDPFFGIQMYYWYQLRAKLVGSYRSCFVKIELRDIDGKKSARSAVTRVARRPEIFALYDSASAPEAGGKASAARTVGEWQRRSWPSLLVWFVLRNFDCFLKPFAFTVLAVVVVGWGGQLMGLLSSSFAAAAKVKKVDAGPTKSDPAPVKRVQTSEQVLTTRVGVEDSAQSSEVKRLESELKQAALDAQAAREKLAAYEAEFSELRVVAPGVCVFGAGYSMRVGEVVEHGAFAGKAVEEIDYARRRVRVGGQWVRLSASGKSVNSDLRTSATSGSRSDGAPRRSEDKSVGQQSTALPAATPVGD